MSEERRQTIWEQVIAQKDEFIGGVLEDLDEDYLTPGATTTITDLTLQPGDNEGAYFTVRGKDYSCGLNTAYGGIGRGEPGWLTLYGYGGIKFRVRKRDE